MAGSSRNPGTSFIVSRSMYAAGFQPLGSCRVCGKMYPRCCIRVDTLVVSRLATRGRVHVTLCTQLDASFCSSLGFEKYLVHACKQFRRQGLLKAMLRRCIGERKNYIVKSWGRAKNTRSTGLWLSSYFCQGSRSNSWNFTFDSLEEPEHPISELHMLISIESSWRCLRFTRSGFSLHRENIYIELVQIF